MTRKDFIEEICNRLSYLVLSELPELERAKFSKLFLEKSIKVAESWNFLEEKIIEEIKE